MDHVLTSDSLTPSLGISKAVLDMPQPENKAATCRFLGTIMYLSKFCPHLSRVAHPLRDLTHLKQQFIWADQHTKAFQEAKHLVSTAHRLRYFDMNSPAVLQVDALDYGLGAVLLQPSLSSMESSEIEWQPVAYSSSSLTPTEKRSGQFEKETLAIVHAFHKFDQLLCDKADIIIHTDHKPLKAIFKRSLASTPRRLQSMLLSLQRYSFRAEYRKRSTLLIANTLSRAPLLMSSHEPVNDLVHTEVNSKVATPQQIKNKQSYEHSWNQTGQPTKPQSLNLYGHTWMFAVNLTQMKDFSISKIVLLFPLLYAQASCTNYMQLTVAPVLSFATLHIPLSGPLSGPVYKLPDMCTAHTTASARATAAITREDTSMASSFTGPLRTEWLSVSCHSRRLQ